MSRYQEFLAGRPERKILYRQLLALVIPITIQNLLGSLVNSADVLMLGYVGQDELSAVSLANQYVFILWGFFFGINSASTIMNSDKIVVMDDGEIRNCNHRMSFISTGINDFIY